MGLVLAHLAVKSAVRSGAIPQAHEVTAHVVAFASVFLPTVVATFRTQLAANEIARNRNRSHARYAALTTLARRLDPAERPLLRITQLVEETQQPAGLRVSHAIEGPADAAVSFGNLVLSEQILATDQREWLRLMLEAEWYR